MTETQPVLCRVCGTISAKLIGSVEFYQGYAWPIFDCAACGSRFTNHDESVYDLLHSGTSSCYVRYREILDTCKILFDRGDLSELRNFLESTPKYKFILDEIDRHDPASHLLEFGCSRGYLTSYGLLSGKSILGTDVSQAALEAATLAFGPNFFQPSAPEIAARVPYSMIYHVGTIGCVADPLGLTRKLLAMLKPGGILLFNAPNRDRCFLKDQMWFESAPPPDVVTLFKPGFWKHQFQDEADVDEQVEVCSPHQNTVLCLQKLFGLKWSHPLSLPLKESKHMSMPPARLGRRCWNSMERAVGKAGRLTGLDNFAPPQPTEFGLFVKMVRK